MKAIKQQATKQYNLYIIIVIRDSDTVPIHNVQFIIFFKGTWKPTAQRALRPTTPPLGDSKEEELPWKRKRLWDRARLRVGGGDKSEGRERGSWWEFQAKGYIAVFTLAELSVNPETVMLICSDDSDYQRVLVVIAELTV